MENWGVHLRLPDVVFNVITLRFPRLRYSTRWESLWVPDMVWTLWGRDVSCSMWGIKSRLHCFPASFLFLYQLSWPFPGFLVIKPTRCTNFTNLFCHENLHVSGSSSVHHQEFIHCTLSNGICHTGFVTNFFVIKPNRCTNFTNLFCHENLHVSGSSSVHHQEFIHCTLSSGICHTGL